jgi:hypothetical protein
MASSFGDLSGQFALALINDYYTRLTHVFIYCDLQQCGFIPHCFVTVFKV